MYRFINHHDFLFLRGRVYFLFFISTQSFATSFCQFLNENSLNIKILMQKDFKNSIFKWIEYFKKNSVEFHSELSKIRVFIFIFFFLQYIKRRYKKNIFHD